MKTPLRPTPLRLRQVLFIGGFRNYYRDVARGIISHAREARNWSLHVTEWRDLPDDLTDFDGAITNNTSRGILERLQAAKRPVVNISSAAGNVAVPSVVNDNHTIGRMAAAHLIERRLPHFATVAPGLYRFGTARAAAFAEAVGEHGHPCGIRLFESAFSGHRLTPAERDDLADWLRRLPKPLGLFAATDGWAETILRLCRRIELRVPDEVAVVGVDNDEMIATVVHPPLTSIESNAHRIGRTAAQWLDLLMAGQPAPQQRLEIPPLAVHPRESTDVLHVSDRLVVDAWRCILANVDGPLAPRDVAHHVAAARRTLERRFRTAMGQTLGQAIRRARIARAQRLLSTTNQPLVEVAAACGFSQTEHLFAAFRAVTGDTPAAWRASVRGETPDGRSTRPRRKPAPPSPATMPAP